MLPHILEFFNPNEQNILNLFYKQMVSLPEEEGAGDGKSTLNQREQDSEDEGQHVPQRTYQLHKKKEFVPSNLQTAVRVVLIIFSSFTH